MPSECPPADGSAPKTQRFDGPPPMCIDLSKRYTAEMVTSKGTMVFSLDAVSAPRTVNNFVFLARYHYFDGIVVPPDHPRFRAAGGDPEGTGAGGPGYRFEDELPQAGRYELGSLAMANAGPEHEREPVLRHLRTGRHAPASALLAVRPARLRAGRRRGDRRGRAAPRAAPKEKVVIESVTITEAD